MVANLEKKFSALIFTILCIFWYISFVLCGSIKRWLVEVISSFVTGWIPLVNLIMMILHLLNAYKIGQKLENGETVPENEIAFEMLKGAVGKFTLYHFIMGLLIKDDGAAPAEAKEEAKEEEAPEAEA